jgi:hypothetical protein
MSIRITSATEWFRCIGPTATLEERRAALAKLVRMLCGDSNRPRPPISLPGRPAMQSAPPTATAPAAPTVKYFRRALPTGKVITAPSKDGDGRGPYSPRRLRRMDAQFHRALERAIALGQERPHA